MRAPILLVAAWLAFASPTGAGLASPPAAQQDPGLATGMRQVDEGDFEGAVTTLTPVAARLAKVGGHDAALACLYLAIAQLALDQADTARRWFREALEHEPSLRLGPDRFSPKVIAALEEARRERDAAASPKPQPGSGSKKGHAGRTALIAGAGVAAGVGVALAAGHGSSTTGADVAFLAARFGTPVLECPNGSAGTPLVVAIDVNAQNGGSRAVTITAATAVLIIVASPAVPSEVGFAASVPATVTPTTLAPGTTVLRVQTTLTCDNGDGDASRYNEWKGRLTLTTTTAQTIETVDTLRVNLP
jgi:hypothetical protein